MHPTTKVLITYNCLLTNCLLTTCLFDSFLGITPLILALQTHRCRKSPAFPNSCAKCIKALVDAGVCTDEMVGHQFYIQFQIII